MKPNPFEELYPTEEPDMDRMQEMDSISEPAYRKWLEWQEHRERRSERLYLVENIAVGLIVLVLLTVSLIRILG